MGGARDEDPRVTFRFLESRDALGGAICTINITKAAQRLFHKTRLDNNANINTQNITKENSAAEVHSLGEKLAGRAATTEAAVTDSLGEQLAGRVMKPATG